MTRPADRVERYLKKPADRVGSGRVGSGRVGSGRVGSGQEMLEISLIEWGRVMRFWKYFYGSGRVALARSDPTRRDPTREKSLKVG